MGTLSTADSGTTPFLVAGSARRSAPAAEARRKWYGVSRQQCGQSERRKLFKRKPSAPVRRLQISAPTNFIHVHSESFNFPEYPQPIRQTRRNSFRPLELNLPSSSRSNRASSIVTQRNQDRTSPPPEYTSPPATPPPRAAAVYVTPPSQIIKTHSMSSPDSFTLSHSRSYSSMSFHIPRRSEPSGSVFESPLSQGVQEPSPAHIQDSPVGEDRPQAMNELIDKVANAMMERDILQQQIDDVVDRQSAYTSSPMSVSEEFRPSSASSNGSYREPLRRRPMRPFQPGALEPMPETPALPPNAPSFSQRVSRERFGNAPPTWRHTNLAHVPRSHKKFVPRYGYYPPLNRDGSTPLSPPPTPHPPLRKKRSFTHVTNWLGVPGGQVQANDIRLEMLGSEAMSHQSRSTSYDHAFDRRLTSNSLGETMSNWSSIGDEQDNDEDEQTIPTNWSPNSDSTVRTIQPLRQLGERELTPQPLQRRSNIGLALC